MESVVCVTSGFRIPTNSSKNLCSISPPNLLARIHVMFIQLSGFSGQIAKSEQKWKPKSVEDPQSKLVFEGAIFK